MAPSERVAIAEAWRVPEARQFFRNVWPLYVHELSGFGSGFYSLDETGRWLPDIVEDWISEVTPQRNLRVPRQERDAAQPFQRAHVIQHEGRPVGFVCLGMSPFKYMPEDADVTVAECFVSHEVRGTGFADRALELLLRRHAGRWHLRVLPENARALRFWRRALPSLGVRDLVEGREEGDVAFRFVAGGQE